MNWEIIYLPEAIKDYEELSRSQQIIVDKALEKVQKNPLPQNEGGYGKPLGHKYGINLTGNLKIKLRNEGIRVVYKLIRTNNKMLVVVIGMRENEEVYETAYQRIKKHSLL